MSNVCDLMAGIGVMSGNNVSHSKRRTKRKFLPNMQSCSLFSDSLNVKEVFQIAAKTLRTINKYGTFDAFLVNIKPRKLTEEAKKLRKKVIAKLESQGKLDDILIEKKEFKKTV